MGEFFLVIFLIRNMGPGPWVVAVANRNIKHFLSTFLTIPSSLCLMMSAIMNSLAINLSPARQTEGRHCATEQTAVRKVQRSAKTVQVLYYSIPEVHKDAIMAVVRPGVDNR